jgi:hypothetical protein
VQWFIEQLPNNDWPKRREAVGRLFYQSLVGERADLDPKGRFFNEKDMFGWYLFLGESFTDHPWNYEVFFGCRVIPILGAIGRNLDVLQTVEGFVERARSVATTERSQPNAGLFEILVAAAYACRLEGQVQAGAARYCENLRPRCRKREETTSHRVQTHGGW